MNPDDRHDAVPERLARIWRDALNAAHIDEESDFFELGGHSLLALRICMEADEVFGVEVQSSDLIIDSSFSAMAGRIRAALRAAADAGSQQATGAHA